MNKITINKNVHILEFPPTNKTILYKKNPVFVNIPVYQQFIFRNYSLGTDVYLLGSKNQFNEVNDDAYTILLPNIKPNGYICHDLNNLLCKEHDDRLKFMNYFWLSDFPYYIPNTIVSAVNQKLIKNVPYISKRCDPEQLYPIKLIKIHNYQIKCFIQQNINYQIKHFTQRNTNE